MKPKRLILALMVILVSSIEGKLYPKEIAGWDRLSERILAAIVNHERSMQEPWGCAVIRDMAAQPMILVTDQSLGRFEFFRYGAAEEDKDTVQLSAFGEWGDGPGQYRAPHDIATPDGLQLYILDTENNRIGRAVFHAAQFEVTAQSPIATDVGLNGPEGFTVYDEGASVKIYVADTRNHRILRLSAAGQLEAAYGCNGSGSGQFNNPCDVVRWSEHVYVADQCNNRIVVLEEQASGAFEWKKTVAIPSTYGMITSLDCDANGNVYVVDYCRCSIAKYSPGMDELLWDAGGRGYVSGKYELPNAIAVSKTCNDVLVTEAYTDYSGVRFLGNVVDIVENGTSPQQFDATIAAEFTQVSFKIDDVASVSVDVMYESEHVRWLIEDLMLPAGSHSESFLIWDGTDDAGGLCLPGQYTVRIRATDAYANTAVATIPVVIEGKRVAGTLAPDEHWTEEGEPYVLTGDVQLANNGRLTIDPGVKVMPTGNYVIKEPYWCNAALIAQGSLINKIIFTPHRKLYPEKDSVSHGFWKGIQFRSAYGGDDSLFLNNCVIEAAGSDSAAVYVYNNECPVIITNTEISKSGNYGFLNKQNSVPAIVNACTFKDNDSIPILTSFNSINCTHGNSYINNKPDVIGMVSYAPYVQGTNVVHNEGVPYWFLRRYYSYKYFGFFNDSPDSCGTLIIEPGTTLMFDDSTYLLGGQYMYATDRARLLAIGTETDSIIFTAIDTAKGWGGVRMHNTNNYPDTSKMEYCRISYGGQGVNAYGLGNLVFRYIHNPYILRNSTIARSKSIGVNHYASDGNLSVIPVIENNQFIANDSFPLRLWANALPDVSDNLFSANRQNEIYVKGERINQSMSWRNQGVPYVVDGQISIQGYGDTTVAVEVERGNVLKFKSGGLYVGSDDRLIARGVRFTQADSQPWTGRLIFNNADTSVIDSCVIEHTWSQYNYNGAVDITKSPVKITNSQISNNRTGVVIYDNSDVEIVNDRIVLNENGVWVRAALAQVLVKNNEFSGNKCACISSHSASYPYTLADSNWWGDASGPWDPVEGVTDYNPAGRGDSVGDYVTYRPWLESPLQEQLVTLVTPNGGEELFSGQACSIEWTVLGDKKHSRRKAGTLSDAEQTEDQRQGVDAGSAGSRAITLQELYYCRDYPEGGAKASPYWQFIDTVSAEFRKYNWIIPGAPSNRVRVAVKVLGDSLSLDISDANFSITDTVRPVITIVKPDGGEYFIPGVKDTIRWEASDNHGIASQQIVLSTDNGVTYPDTIAKTLGPAVRSYLWTPNEKDAYQCRIKITVQDSSDNTQEDISDGTFAIPVRALASGMTAHNNGRRLIRQFSRTLHLVYTTGDGSKESEVNPLPVISARAFGDDVPGDPGAEKLRGTLQVAYRRSTDLGLNWQTVSILGDGWYPTLATNADASQMAVCWLNSAQTKLQYAYATNGTWSSAVTLVDEVSGVTYQPVSAQLVADSMRMVTLRTTVVDGANQLQDVIFLRCLYSNPAICVMDTIDHWRLVNVSGQMPARASLAVSYDRKPYVAWERPPGPDTLYSGTLPPLDIYYAYYEKNDWNRWNVSASANEQSQNPALDYYGGHTYLVWQEKATGEDNIFLYARNYLSRPPTEHTDTLGSVAGGAAYPVSRLGGAVFWAEGTPPDVYGRIWDSRAEEWLAIDNYSQTPRASTYPVLDAWQSEGGIGIIAGWTESTDTCGLGRAMIDYFPAKDGNTIAFPSYYLDLGQASSTPFTLYRDTVQAASVGGCDLGVDSLVYTLPYVNPGCSHRLFIELHRPANDRRSGKGGSGSECEWRVLVNADGILHRLVRLAPGQTAALEVPVPASVVADSQVVIRLKRVQGDYILARRLLWYEYEPDAIAFARLPAGGTQAYDDIALGRYVFTIAPNPFVTEAQITFSVPGPDCVPGTIRVYDAAGRCVMTMPLAAVQTWRGTDDRGQRLSGGVYFIEIQVQGQSLIRKAVLLR